MVAFVTHTDLSEPEVIPAAASNATDAVILIATRGALDNIIRRFFGNVKSQFEDLALRGFKRAIRLQRHRGRFAGGYLDSVRGCAMAEPRTKLTALELIYAATALRAEAR